MWVVSPRIEQLSGAMAVRVERHDGLSHSALLDRLKAARAAENAAAADQLLLAATWADRHPPESIHDAAAFTVPGSEHEEPIAGAGCPAVAEFCIAELGAVLGTSTTSAKRLMGHALELRHRLPRLWARVHAGAVPAWRARAVAEATIHATPALTREAAGWVDSQVAGVAARVGPAQLDRLVAEAIKRHHLAEEPIDHDDGIGVDPRYVRFDHDEVSYAGTVRVEAEVGIVDGLDLDHALRQRAAVLKALGSTESLDVRRSRALGELARLQTSLDLAAAAGAVRDVDRLPPAREVVLHAHLEVHATKDGGIAFGPTGRLEEGQRLVLLDQVKSWCGDSGTTVVVRPVIDLSSRLETPAYAVPDRIREHVVLRDRTCVFPWCSRPARTCQVDHVVPHDPTADAEGRPQPGPTATDNLAALCTWHHRLKTHGRWSYAVTAPGRFEWTSPHGHRYRRDPTGTTTLDPDPPEVPRPRRR